MKLLILSIALVLSVIGVSIQPAIAQTASAPAATQSIPAHKAICTQVIDGDTIKLDTGETVRLIGVDTPETVHPTKPVERFGKEASAFTKAMVEGKPVTLHFDQDTKDRYGRTLAYVEMSNGTFLNEAIIAYGYGYAYTQFPFAKMEHYRAQERAARENKRGLWADAPAAVAATPAPVAAQPVAPVAVQAVAPQTPTQPQEEQVLITPTGKKYHSSTCRHAKTGVPYPISEAKRRGLTACGVCGG